MQTRPTYGGSVKKNSGFRKSNARRDKTEGGLCGKQTSHARGSCVQGWRRDGRNTEGVEVRAAGAGERDPLSRYRDALPAVARTLRPWLELGHKPSDEAANLFAPTGAHRSQLRATEHADLTRRRSL